MKRTTLGRILTAKQLRDVTKILNTIPDSGLRVAALKKYFTTIRRRLKKHDVVPDYLAYLVEHTAREQTMKSVKNN